MGQRISEVRNNVLLTVETESNFTMHRGTVKGLCVNGPKMDLMHP